MNGRNWDWHSNVVDVSPFLLYESTGDSEAISDFNMENSELRNYEVADDDALSCCSDSYDTTTYTNKNYGDRAQCSGLKSKKNEEVLYANKSKKKEQECAYNPNYRDCNNDDDDEEDDGAINQVWSSCGKMGYVVSRQQKKKNSKSNAFVMEPKQENDKLFWDNCLGS